MLDPSGVIGCAERQLWLKLSILVVFAYMLHVDICFQTAHGCCVYKFVLDGLQQCRASELV